MLHEDPDTYPGKLPPQIFPHEKLTTRNLPKPGHFTLENSPIHFLTNISTMKNYLPHSTRKFPPNAS